MLSYQEGEHEDERKAELNIVDKVVVQILGERVALDMQVAQMLERRALGVVLHDQQPDDVLKRQETRLFGGMSGEGSHVAFCSF